MKFPHLKFVLLVAGLLLGSCGLGRTLWAGSISAQLEPQNPLAGEPALLTVLLEGDAEEPQIPEVEGGEIVGRSSSSRFTLVNGKSSHSKEYRYTLSIKPGSYTLPPIKAEIDGQMEATGPLSFTVTTDSAGAAATGEDDSPSQKSVGWFARAKLSKARAYVGEQILLTVQFFYRTNVSDLRLNGPATPGFFVEELGEGSTTVENIDGRQWRVVTLHKALYPRRSGKLTLPAATFDFLTVKSNRFSNDDIFERFFRDPFFTMGVRQGAKAQTPPLTLEVEAVPTVGRPPNYSGLVGDVEVNLAGPKSGDSVGRGSSLTLTTQLRGRAYLKSDLALPLGDPTMFKRYDDKPTVKSVTVVQAGERRIQQERTQKIAIVPQKAGPLTLGPISITTFDPESKTFKVVTSPAVALTVTASPESDDEKFVVTDALPPQVIGNRGPQRLTEDLIANHEGAQIGRSQTFDPFRRKTWWLIWLALPLGFILGSHRLVTAATLARQRQRLAAKKSYRALRHLERAKKMSGSQGAIERHQLFTTYLKERFLLPEGVLTNEEIHRALQGCLAPTALIAKVVTELNELEAKRLGLNLFDNDSSQGEIARLRQMIGELEKLRPETSRAVT